MPCFRGHFPNPDTGKITAKACLTVLRAGGRSNMLSRWLGWFFRSERSRESMAPDADITFLTVNGRDPKGSVMPYHLRLFQMSQQDMCDAWPV